MIWVCFSFANSLDWSIINNLNLVGETLEAALGQDGDSEEEDAIVNQVLDEIGIEVNNKVRRHFFSQYIINLFVCLDCQCSPCTIFSCCHDESPTNKRRRCWIRTNPCWNEINSLPFDAYEFLILWFILICIRYFFIYYFEK